MLQQLQQLQHSYSTATALLQQLQQLQHNYSSFGETPTYTLIKAVCTSTDHTHNVTIWTWTWTIMDVHHHMCVTMDRQLSVVAVGLWSVRRCDTATAATAATATTAATAELQQNYSRTTAATAVLQ